MREHLVDVRTFNQCESFAGVLAPSHQFLLLLLSTRVTILWRSFLKAMMS